MRFLRYKTLRGVMGSGRGRVGPGQAGPGHEDSNVSLKYERTRSDRCARSLVTIALVDLALTYIAFWAMPFVLNDIAADANVLNFYRPWASLKPETHRTMPSICKIFCFSSCWHAKLTTKSVWEPSLGTARYRDRAAWIAWRQRVQCGPAGRSVPARRERILRTDRCRPEALRCTARPAVGPGKLLRPARRPPPPGARRAITKNGSVRPA